jgi:hypothetical protein
MDGGRSPDIGTIRDLIVPIVGYNEPKRRLLVGEWQRYRASLEWVQPGRGGSLLDIGSCGDWVPVYKRALGYGRVVCLDEGCDAGLCRFTHADGSVFDCEAIGMDAVLHISNAVGHAPGPGQAGVRDGTGRLWSRGDGIRLWFGPPAGAAHVEG